MEDSVSGGDDARDGDATDHEQRVREAFAAVADGTRAGILEALAERQREAPRDRAMAFSTLRKRVGERDSGNFSYHLDRLRERGFVRKSGDGYVLTPVGMQVVATLRAGTYASDVERGPADVGADCPICGDPLAARYEEGLLTVTCEAGHAMPQRQFPPGGLDDRTFEDAARLAARRSTEDVALVTDGACPLCAGATDVSVRASEVGPIDYRFDAVCTDCGMLFGGPVEMTVARHPAVVALFWDAGLDVRETPLWDLPLLGAAEVEQVADDPLRIEVRISAEDRSVALVLDDSADVVAVEENGDGRTVEENVDGRPAGDGQ